MGLLRESWHADGYKVGTERREILACDDQARALAAFKVHKK